jgi:hypothetical protein
MLEINLNEDGKVASMRGIATAGAIKRKGLLRASMEA